MTTGDEEAAPRRARSGDPSVAEGAATPVHQRSIEFDAFDAGDDLTVVGRLRDRRPWAQGTAQVELLHDMELRVTVRKEGLRIVDAEAVMRRFPHAECPSIVDAFRGLVGLSVSSGYVREVQRRFGGAAGCTHLDQLARALGPVVVQAVTSVRARQRGAAAPLAGADEDAVPRPSTFPVNTCHVWSDGGVAEQKLAAGWRPGDGGYPAPPLSDIVGTGD